ncbi:MAG: apolipoprotein N-acyltransferase [Bacteroidia bacterium]
MKVFSKKQLYLFSLLTGVLFWAGWPAHGFPFLLLIAFCPLLIVEDHYYRERLQFKAFAFFRYAFIATLSWNILSTWWVINSTIVGGIAAIVLNSLFMALVLVFFHYIRMKTNNLSGYAALVILWISFEYFHLNWQCSWPWLTLGNGFANYANCVQWYELTGALGGSLWILCANLIFFQLIKRLWIEKTDSKSPKSIVWAAISIVIVPLILSFIILSIRNNTSDKGKGKVNIVVVQPNIDPYNEKFSGDFKNQVEKMLGLADTKVDSTTDYLVFPETALTDPDIWENGWDSNYSIQTLKKYLLKHPRLSLITGASTNRAYNKGDSIPESARKFLDGDGYYDSYNTAIQLNNNYKLQYYHKSKLVPGVETMPFNKLLGPIADLAFKLGGISGTLGTQKEPSVLYSPDTKTSVGVAICYESIYGEYVGKYVQKGAQLIFIITNDGWWQDTPGYRQHLCYARLRAIETRRCIARAANTGISAFINENGDILQHTGWWQPAVIEEHLTPYNGLTFYVRNGDYIGRAACCLCIPLLLFLAIAFLRKK